MRHTKRSLFFLTLLASSFALQGCLTGAIIGGTAVAGAAAKVATDPRTAGRQVDDETLEEYVLSALNKDTQLKEESRLSVVSYEAKVLLIGEVPSYQAKEVAYSLASAVEGVSKVVNELTVGPTIGFAQISKDSWITTQVKSKLIANTDIKARNIKVVTENGVVYLMGKVNSTIAEAAAQIASQTPSVTKVVKAFNIEQ